jgi:hypothetical protein
MTTMLMLCLSAGLALGLVANVFRLLALSVAFVSICLLTSIRLGAPHPIATTLACLSVLEVGYAAGLFLLAQSHRWNPSIEQKKLRPGRR